MKAAYRQRRDFVYEQMTSLGFQVAKPDGAFYILLKFQLATCKMILNLRAT